MDRRKKKRKKNEEPKYDQKTRVAKPRIGKRVDVKRKRATISSSRQTSLRTQSTYVRSIQRNGRMIPELKRDKTHKSTDYKCLVEEVLGEDVEVRALTADATLKVKNLNEVTNTEELITATVQGAYRRRRVDSMNG